MRTAGIQNKGVKTDMRPGFQRVDKKELVLKGVNDIVVLGDVGCTGLSEESKDVFKTILRNKADLFVVAGDLALTGAKDELTAFIDICDSDSQAPVFSLCGNHDLPGYPELCGLSTYAIVLDRVVCVLLDNSNARFKEEDLAFLKDQLEKHPGKNFIVVFHIPPPIDFKGSVMREEEWHKLRAVLEKHRERIKCLICGHIHGYYRYQLDGYSVIITGGGGAAMIYDMPKEEFRAHHAYRLSLKDNETIDIKFLPAGRK